MNPVVEWRLEYVRHKASETLNVVESFHCDFSVEYFLGHDSVLLLCGSVEALGNLDALNSGHARNTPLDFLQVSLQRFAFEDKNPLHCRFGLHWVEFKRFHPLW